MDEFLKKLKSRLSSNKIDTDGSGKLDYGELIKILALKGSGNNPNVNPVWKLKDPELQTMYETK